MLVGSPDHAVTLSITFPPLPCDFYLHLLFSLAVQASPVYGEALSRSQVANMLSFRYPGGQEVSVLVSKSGGRYRLQASCLEAMWLVLQVCLGWGACVCAFVCALKWRHIIVWAHAPANGL